MEPKLYSKRLSPEPGQHLQAGSTAPCRLGLDYNSRCMFKYSTTIALGLGKLHGLRGEGGLKILNTLTQLLPPPKEGFD